MSLRDLRRQAGRLAVVGFNGVTPPDDVRRLAAEFDLGGVIYFARNIQDPPQVADLTRAIASWARDWPFWISVDQEGGRVARLKRPFTEWPPMQTLGRAADPKLAERFAQALAHELGAVGITLDFAPVLDVLTHAQNPAIGDRALSDNSKAVEALGRAIIRGLQSNGVAACGKHFPGHGDTTVDSHFELPIVEHDRRRFDEVEWPPFRAAINEGVASMMVGHLMALGLDERRPASLSRTIVSDLLKRELAFDGVVFCDDLGMKAVAHGRSQAEIFVETIEAGCDVGLLCNSSIDEQIDALEQLIYAVESGRIKATRIDDAMKRQERMKARFAPSPKAALPSLSVVGCEAHQMIAAEMAAWR